MSSYVPYLTANALADIAIDQGQGFAPRDAVELAAALFAPATPQRYRREHVAAELGWWVEVSPGSVRLRSARQKPAVKLRNRFPAQGRLPLDEDRDEVIGVISEMDDDLHALDMANEGELDDEPAPRGEITMWSRKSRARMVHSMAATDWTPVLAMPGHVPGMITLTYPGHWQAVAPDAATVKRHWAALRKRWKRDLGRPLQCAWKLEFQRRGAPHLHVYAAVPLGDVRRRTGRGRGAFTEVMPFREWLSLVWFEIVGSGDERHLRAGTGIDFSKGLRSTDPKRLAVYFAKHNGAGGGKEYQHRPPDSWESTGRWWGIVGLDRITAEVQIDYRQAVEIKRTMRRWLKAQRRTRTVTRTRHIVDPDAAEMTSYRSRTMRRRYKLLSLEGGATLGATLLVNDGPRFAEALSQVVCRTDVDT